jgi:hypothetical protein
MKKSSRVMNWNPISFSNQVILLLFPDEIQTCSLFPGCMHMDSCAHAPGEDESTDRFSSTPPLGAEEVLANSLYKGF